MARHRSYNITLSKDERKIIKKFQKKTSSSHARTRCAILLAADSTYNCGKTYQAIADRAGSSVATVIKTLKEFSENGFTKTVTPNRNPNSDTARLKATGDVEAMVIATACSPAPKGYVRWTLNLLYNQMMVVLEDAVSISRATIGRILVKNDLRPHLNEYWCIPPNEDAEFVAHMEDILDVYQQPYDPEYPLWCMDEKPYQILDESRNPLPMRPGDTAKIDSEYVRNGTVSIYCFVQPHTGKILHAVEPTRTAVDWAEKIKYLADEIEPDAKKIVLVMDNLNTHSVASLYKAFPPEEARRLARRLEVHYTPKHGSWLNIAEIAINIMTRECLNRRIPNMDALKMELKTWNAAYNQDPSPVNWQFQSEDSRTKLRSLYPDIEKNRQDRDARRAAKAKE